MKKYENAKIEYVELSTKDVVAVSGNTSGGNWGDGGNASAGAGGNKGDNW